MTNRQMTLPDLLRDIELGPAMKRLTEKQQNFVYAMIETGGLNNTRAAKAAGYGGESDSLSVTGYRLAHDEKIQEAIREMAPRMLNAGLFIAARYVLETIDNPAVDTKDRLKAAEMIMNRTGLHPTTEHKVAVTHKSESVEATIQRIESMARSLGIDPQKLLGQAYIEVDYEEVTQSYGEDDIERSLL